MLAAPFTLLGRPRNIWRHTMQKNAIDGFLPHTQCLLTPPRLARRRVARRRSARHQVRPAQAPTRKSTPPWIEPPRTRLTRAAAGPLPSVPHQSAHVDPPKDQHRIGEPYVCY